MKRILVGLDGSPRSAAVLQYALELARATDGKLLVIRAVGIPHEVPPEALVMSPSDLPKLLTDRATADLARLTEGVPKDRLDGVLAHVGTPWNVICDTAKTRDCSLIVIGTHGHTALDTLLGTTAARVVNHAHCSVLVVRNR